MSASNLMGTDEGRSAMAQAARYLLQRRFSRFFKTNLVETFNHYLSTGEFPLSRILGALNGANDAEILNLYRLLGIAGGLPESVCDIEVFVDAVNGSDVTGTGSSDLPYSSMWFLPLMPRKINHNYRIYLRSNVSILGPCNFDFDFGPDGALAVIGQGVYQTVSADLEIDTVDALLTSVGQLIKFTGVVADCTGDFLLALDGAEANKAVPIHAWYTPDSVVVPYGALNGVAPGDICRVVTPFYTLSARSFGFSCRNDTSTTTITNDSGKINITNLQLLVSGTGNPKQQAVLIDNTCVQSMSFVKLVPFSPGGDMTIKSAVNTSSAMYEGDHNSGIQNIVSYANMEICGLSINGTTTLPFDVILNGGSLSRTSTRKIVKAYGNSIISHVTAQYFESRNANLDISYSLAEENINVSHNGGGIVIYSSKVTMNYFTATIADGIIVVRENSDVSIKNSGENVISDITESGIIAWGCTRAEIWDAASVAGLIDVSWATLTNVVPFAHVAIPAVFSWITDAQGSFVKRFAT